MATGSTTPRTPKGRPTLEHNPRGETVAQVVEMSLATAAQKLKPGPLAGYRLMYNRAILPKFARLRVTAITLQRVEAWVAKWTAQRLAPHTVHNYWVGLSRLFTYAIQHRIHPGPNPCTAVERPKKRPREDFVAQFLTATQVEAVTGHLAEREEWTGALFRFMSFTGLRASEVAGLRVQDVVLGGGARVEVRQTYRRINTVWVKGTPKSPRSTRDVPILSKALVAELRKVLLANPNSGNPAALFWPARENGSRRLDWTRPITMNGFLNYYLLPAAQAGGVDHIRNHDTRHTAHGGEPVVGGRVPAVPGEPVARALLARTRRARVRAPLRQRLLGRGRAVRGVHPHGGGLKMTAREDLRAAALALQAEIEDL